MSTRGRRRRTHKRASPSPELQHTKNHNHTATGTTPNVSPGAGKRLAPVSPPGSEISYTKFVYVMVLGAALLLIWHIYGAVTLLGKLKQETGWLGLLVGSGLRGSRWESTARSVEKEMLDDRLTALADALGVPAEDIASAIKPIVPSSISFTNMASNPQDTGVSEAVKVFLDHEKEGNTGLVGGIVESVVGSESGDALLQEAEDVY